MQKLSGTKCEPNPNEIPIVDIGCNLSGPQFKNGYLAELVEHSFQAFIEGIITISNKEKEWATNLDIVKAYKDASVKIYMTLGVHPHDAKEVKDSTYQNFEKFINGCDKASIIAVGECGLDYNRMFSPKEKQIEVFKKQIELATKYKKPLYMHERDASEDMIKILKAAKTADPSLEGVIHCFTGKKATLKAYLDLGFSIGITGWICDDRRNNELVEAIKELPLDKMMIETDSPWLIPQQYAKKYDTRRNEPDSLSYIIEAIAKHTKFDVAKIRKQTRLNTTKLFGI